MKTLNLPAFAVLIFTGVVMTITADAASAVPKFGYVPVTFPRDVALVNQFAEHVVLGQILEPLVDADRFGSMTRGIAESWNVSADGKTLSFKIGADQRFSNGKLVEAKDVKYSIDRHLNEKTQSSNFVRAIKEVNVKSPSEIEIVLSEPNVSILKALTRDHLGIVPYGWKYDSNSDEPIIGSGPYRLKKKNAKWHLLKNDRYSKAASIPIPEWELVFYKNEALDLPEGVLPDYVPVATQTVLDELKTVASKQQAALETQEQLSFAQTSLWWYPHGTHYRSQEIKSRAMTFLTELVEKKTQEKKLHRATGIVPVGIAGFLPDPIKFDPKKEDVTGPKTKLALAGLGNAFAFLFEGETAKKLAAKYGFEVEFYTFTPSELGTIKNRKPDVLMASWAGGFNDPEGFLPLLNQVLGVDFVEYLENLRPLYQSARVEQDWTKRSELFREFNQKIVLEKRMVPGWKLTTYSVAKRGLAEDKVGFRYTPRLINVKRTN